MTPVLGVAVVGLGEVAQNTHLPTLLLLSHLFRTVALADVSPGARAHAAAKFHVPLERTYDSLATLLADPAAEDVDLVMVMSSNQMHVVQAIEALEAGKHVFVEKPLALTLRGAEIVESARQKAGKVVFVGTMRRYATAFERVKARVKEVGNEGIAYVRVRDIIGKNDSFVAQSGAYPLKFDDVPPEERNAANVLLNSQLRTVLGERADSLRDVETYLLLATLSVHDLSALRELVGMPKRILCAARSADNTFLSVTFDYGSFVAYYEVGIDDVPVFDAHIEVYTHKERIKVSYDTPYVKGLPITATVQGTSPNGDYSEQVLRPTFEDAFTLEYKALHDAIVNGTPVKTSPLDSCEDLQLFKMIMDAVPI